jgi:hypothetical protein
MVINTIYNQQFMVINSDYYWLIVIIMVINSDYYYGILITIIITINQ